MLYKKGTQDYTLDECVNVKVRLTDGMGFSESPWGKQHQGRSEVVLQNHALAFTPYPSWGVVLPSTSLNFLAMLEAGELTLHPEAWEQYIEQSVIDETGAYLHPVDEDTEEEA
tara:strand:+ start:1143 stop:1481 length:339 start_codon:yes stop_codon:yes gene_type:complete